MLFCRHCIPTFIAYTIFKTPLQFTKTNKQTNKQTKNKNKTKAKQNKKQQQYYSYNLSNFSEIYCYNLLQNLQ